jgi:hypothetical protein
MSGSRGTIYAHRLFSVRDLGFANPEPNVSLLIRAFLKIGEAVAARWIEMPGAILLLQMAPDDPASGAIYIYDRRREEFYMICFEGEDDHLSMEDFEAILSEYGLLRYVEHPRLLAQLPPPPAYEPVEVAATEKPLYAYVYDLKENAGYILCFAAGEVQPPADIRSLLRKYRLLWCVKVAGDSLLANRVSGDQTPPERIEAQAEASTSVLVSWSDAACISPATRPRPQGLLN